MKTCLRCGERKSAEDFYRCARKPDGLDIYCKDCYRVMRNEWNRRNRKPNDGITIGKDGVKRIRKGRSMSIYWDGNMLSAMKLYFPTTTNEEMLELLGGQVSLRTMLRKAREMGLKKDSKWLEGVWKERILFACNQSKKLGYPGAYKCGKVFTGNQFVNADGSPKHKSE